MKFILLVFVLSFLPTVSFTQGTSGYIPPAFVSSYKKCVEWEKPKAPVKVDGQLLEYPAKCIRYKTCREQAVPGESILVSCECYLGLTQRHPNWCENCVYPSTTAIGVGDSKKIAEEESRSICNLSFKEIMSNKDPSHYDFKVNYCRQKGQEVCE